MTIDLDILALTFEEASRTEPQFPARFYDCLITRYPACRDVFTDGISRKQERMLARALVAMLAHLDDPIWLNDTLPPLGQWHERLGVRPEMYGWFSRCLVDCLAANAAKSWSPEAEVHWRAALTLVSTLMTTGHRDG